MAKQKEEFGGKKKVESKYNASSLRFAINQGQSATEIMQQLGILHKQTLKQYVLKLISDDRQFYEVRGLYMKNSRRPRVNKYGTVRLILKHLDLGDLTFAEGDEFSVTTEDGKIVLSKI